MSGDKSGGAYVYVPEVSRSDMDRIIGKLAEGGDVQLKRLAGLSKAMDSREVYRVDIDRMISKMADEGKDLLDGLGRLSRDLGYYDMRARDRAAQASCGPVEAAPRRPGAVVYGKESVEPPVDGPDDNDAGGLDSKLADLWNAASGMLDILDGMRGQK